MSSHQPTASVSKPSLWTGRIISGILVALLCLDAAVKFFKPAPVVEAFIQLGYNPNMAFGLGVLLLTCTLLYAIPRTSVLGAILLTGYFGGASATHLRVGADTFSVIFPPMLGVLIWGGLYLRDHRLQELLPLRRTERPEEGMASQPLVAR